MSRRGKATREKGRVFPNDAALHEAEEREADDKYEAIGECIDDTKNPNGIDGVKMVSADGKVINDKMSTTDMARLRVYLTSQLEEGQTLSINTVSYPMLLDVRNLICRWLRPRELVNIVSAPKTATINRGNILINNTNNNVLPNTAIRAISGNRGVFFDRLTSEHNLFYIWFNLDATKTKGTISIYALESENIRKAAEEIRARIKAYNRFMTSALPGKNGGESRGGTEIMATQNDMKYSKIKGISLATALRELEHEQEEYDAELNKYDSSGKWSDA